MLQDYTQTEPRDLIEKLFEETRCIMDMREESEKLGDEPDSREDSEERIALYLRGIALVGKAWECPEEAEEAVKELHGAAPAGDTWTPMDEQILTVLWGLFDTAVRLESRDEREEIRQLAQEIMDFHALDIRVQSL